MTVTLRPATDSDWEFLFDLHRASFREYVEPLFGWDEEWQADRFRAWVELDHRQVVQLDGQDIGSLAVVEHPAWLFVEYLAIHPGHQRQGIGTRLARLFLAEARAKGVCVRSNVLRGNPALGFYERLGFGIIGGDDERHYLEHPGGTVRPDEEEP